MTNSFPVLSVSSLVIVHKDVLILCMTQGLYTISFVFLFPFMLKMAKHTLKVHIFFKKNILLLRTGEMLLWFLKVSMQCMFVQIFLLSFSRRENACLCNHLMDTDIRWCSVLGFNHHIAGLQLIQWLNL